MEGGGWSVDATLRRVEGKGGIMNGRQRPSRLDFAHPRQSYGVLAARTGVACQQGYFLSPPGAWGYWIVFH